MKFVRYEIAYAADLCAVGQVSGSAACNLAACRHPFAVKQYEAASCDSQLFVAADETIEANDDQ